MSNPTCLAFPEAPNGERSRLYNDLLKKFHSRPITNLFYAMYSAPNSDIGTKMDTAGIARNRQGQHDADALSEFMGFDKFVNDMGSLSVEAKKANLIDNNGKSIDFSDGVIALQKAEDFNEHHQGLVATVVRHGDVFNVLVNEKDSRTHLYADKVKEYLKVWDTYKQAFNAKGIDIDNMPTSLREVFNPLNVGLASYLRGLQQISIDNIYERDALILFKLNKTSPHVQRLISNFGSLEAAARAIADLNHGTIVGLEESKRKLLKRAVNDSQKMQGMDMIALNDQVQNEILNLRFVSSSTDIQAELEALNKKYHIDINEIHLRDDRKDRHGVEKIQSLSEAAANAALLLQRQLRALERERGHNVEGRMLEGTINTLLKELNNKRYYSGILKFLGEAAKHIGNIDNMLNNLPQSGTNLEKAFATSKILQNIQSLRLQYEDLLQALASEQLVIDESINQVDIDNIRNEAAALVKFIDTKKNIINALAENNMLQILKEIVGDKTADGQPIINAVRLASKDSSLMNFLYSMGRASDITVAAAGTIIRNAQDERDTELNKIARRIRKATDALYKAGFNTKFMYEDNEHIASNINWKAYEDARKQEIKSLYAQGFSKFEIKQRIEDWEDANTEEREVDYVNHRKERVPDYKFRKVEDFQEGWSQEQKDYYDEIMQIKGEIGTLLPAMAQKQYLPPQLRRNFLDAVGDAKSLEDILKAVKNKAENLYKIREDDTDFNKRGIIIDGQEYAYSPGAFDNTPLREIPIFFVNKVEGEEILTDFSAGIQALASTALNYDAMNRVAHTVEFMKDFVVNKYTTTSDPQVDMVRDKQVGIFKTLYNRATQSHTESLMNGFIFQHIYGQRKAGIEPDWVTKLGNKLIGYSSLLNLATNVKGATANYIMGEFQMLIEAGAGEFYGFKDYAWAHTKLFGTAGVGGEIMELLTNNMNHKATLMREMFDPLQENFSDKAHKRYHHSMFRQLMSKDCSFIGYSSGEYLIHYVNMYSVLHNTKVLLDDKVISLYDAFKTVDVGNNNAELKLKDNVTTLDGDPITQEFLDKIKRKIRGVNQNTHGSMNAEDKGLIHQYLMGRMVMNFRQWMVEHYSRRFRGRHWDNNFGEYREGYWVSLWKGVFNRETKDTWKSGNHMDALAMFMKDLYTFMFRSQSQWHNLSEDQKYNIQRVKSEMTLWLLLNGLSFALGDPDRHKREYWRRFWIYQTKRALTETTASMPTPSTINSIITMINSPITSINTLNSFFYLFTGIDDLISGEQIKFGDHKGEYKYWRNLKKYLLPGFKDYEQMQNLGEDDALFKVFDTSPANH